MQYSREDAEMQPQHNNNAGGLFTACNKRTRNEKKRGQMWGYQGNLSTFELALGAHFQKFTWDAVTHTLLSQRFLLDAQGSKSWPQVHVMRSLTSTTECKNNLCRQKPSFHLAIVITLSIINLSKNRLVYFLLLLRLQTWFAVEIITLWNSLLKLHKESNILISFERWCRKYRKPGG